MAGGFVVLGGIVFAHFVAGNGARRVLDVLLSEGVDVAFGYPGGAIMPLYDALYGHELRHILVRHEQAAVFAAGSYARASGRVGVCLATSGPGATNLVTGLVDAMMDSIPLVAITGQVKSHLMGTDGFQEADVTAITQSITKHNIIVRTVEEIEPALRRAFALARGPRPGPVLVDIPRDILEAKIGGTSADPQNPVPIQHTDGFARAAEVRANITQRFPANAAEIATAVAMIRAAKRPVAIIGGGVRWADAHLEYREFCAMLGLPHVATINALGAAEPGDPHFLGMMGMHGWKAANRSVMEADLVIALGMRFDDRVTGRVDRFAAKAKIIHADIDASEFNKIIPADATIHADLKSTLTALIAGLKSATPRFDEWAKEAASHGGPLPRDKAQAGMMSATDAIDLFFTKAPKNVYVATDVGQHQMWTAQRSMPIDPNHFITSAGLGTMGFGLPAAIGVQIAHPTATVVSVSGDGGFQMTLHELATLRRHEIPVKILLIDNRNLGMVRQWQQLFFDSRYSATNLSDNPDFCALAHAYGVRAESVSSLEEMGEALERFFSVPEATMLHCACFPEENVWPMIPAGAAIDEGIDGIAVETAKT
jgi:acetolactate synthase-1/2/3 large subunit